VQAGVSTPIARFDPAQPIHVGVGNATPRRGLLDVPPENWPRRSENPPRANGAKEDKTRKSRFTEEQIVGLRTEHEAGLPDAAVQKARERVGERRGGLSARARQSAALP